MNSFTLDEKTNSRAAWGLRITEPPILPPASRKVETIEIDGRDGALTLFKGWEDVTFSMRAALLGANPHGRFRDILPVILAAQSVYFSGDTSVYYRVKYAGAGGLTRLLSALWEFPLTFVCAPFRYLRNVAPVTLTASGTVTNPGAVYALPKITVYGTGSRTLTINGKAIVLNILAGNLTLDSELMECYQGSTAQNNQMSGAFPVFNVGSNTITLGTGITKLEIEPRWRSL